MLIDVTGFLAIDERTREWCKFPYPGHPKGCMNYGKSEECPPKVKLVHEVFDLSKQHWFAVESFDLQEHAAKMKALHPDWSEAQQKCCLYWQNGVRKKQRQTCDEFIKNHSGYIFTLIPEAMGVNVFRTMHRCGWKIRKNPDFVYKVALIGVALRPNKCDENLQFTLAI